MRFRIRVLTLLLTLAACQAPAGGSWSPDQPSRPAIDTVLDDFHQAASDADGERYFGHMTEDAVFLGTDATERWTKGEFLDYAMPHFSAGRGWTYRVLERHVRIAGDVAWFDERLWNDRYGECRGSGALALDEGVWRVAQYNLTIPVPNDLALEFVGRIKEVTGAER